MDLKRIFKFKLKQIVGIRVCSLSLRLSHSHFQDLQNSEQIV